MKTIKNRKTGVISTVSDEDFEILINNPTLTGTFVTIKTPEVPAELKPMIEKATEGKEETGKASKK